MDTITLSDAANESIGFFRLRLHARVVVVGRHVLQIVENRLKTG